jgi:hypothetical protein
VRLVHPDKLQMDTEAEKLKTQQAFRGIYMRSKFSKKKISHRQTADGHRG